MSYRRSSLDLRSLQAFCLLQWFRSWFANPAALRFRCRASFEPRVSRSRSGLADSLPDSIDASALERYDKLALRITRNKFADTVALHNALFSGDVAKNYQEAGLTPVRFGTAFHATMESFASEQGNLTGDVDSMLVASVWQVNLNVQLDAQKAAAAATTAATTMQMDDADANADAAAAAAVTPAKCS